MTTRRTSSERPDLLRTALGLVPVQAFFRGGEAALPLLLAAWFGRSAETDLYYLLSLYFVFAAAVVAGAFQDSALVPVLVEVEKRDAREVPAVAGALLGHTLAASGVVAAASGAVAAVACWVFSSSPALAMELVAMMILGVVATAVRAFYVGVLNARGRFSAHPIASGLGIGLTLALVGAGRGRFGVVVIPAATLAGELLAIGLLAALCERREALRIVPSLSRPEPVRRILRLVRLEVMGSLVTRINPVVDQLASRWAAVVGGGTLLLYAGTVASFPTSILQATLFPVFLTRLSHEASRPAEFLRTTRTTLAATTALLLAGAGALAVARAPVSRLLFLHGVMDPAGAEAIAALLPWALLGAAPFGALLVLARAHVALQNARIMPRMGILNATCNALLDLVLVRPMGLAGIALATSITHAVVAVVFAVLLVRVQRGR